MKKNQEQNKAPSPDRYKMSKHHQKLWSQRKKENTNWAYRIMSGWQPIQALKLNYLLSLIYTITSPISDLSCYFSLWGFDFLELFTV